MNRFLSLRRCRGVKLSFSDTGTEWAGCGKKDSRQREKDRSFPRFDWGKF